MHKIKKNLILIIVSFSFLFIVICYLARLPLNSAPRRFTLIPMFKIDDTIIQKDEIHDTIIQKDEIHDTIIQKDEMFKIHDTIIQKDEMFKIHDTIIQKDEMFNIHDTIIQKDDYGKYKAILRSAFIDTRMTDGHKNRTVIFVEAPKELRKFDLIDGCGVDEVESKDYKVVPLYFSWVQWAHPKLTHEEVMIVCYDLKVSENSTAFVRYRPGNLTRAVTSTINVTYTKRRNKADYANKVVICTTCYGKPPFLKEWLMYQKGIGANLVQMYVEDSFMRDETNLKIIERYVKNGFLKIENRKTHFNKKQVFYHSQILNYNDCLYRYQELYEYAFFIDVDDFFIPRLANKTLNYYLNKVFTKGRAEIRFKWYQFFPDCGYEQPLSSLKDGNVTGVLAYKDKVDTNHSKFVCRPMLTSLTQVHSSYKLKGTTSVFSNDKEAYVGHVRLNRLKGIPDKSKCNII